MHVNWQAWPLAGLPFRLHTAIIVPMAIVPIRWPSPRRANAELIWRNPQLVGNFAACCVSALTLCPHAPPLLTIGIGLAVLLVRRDVIAR